MRYWRPFFTLDIINWTYDLWAKRGKGKENSFIEQDPKAHRCSNQFKASLDLGPLILDFRSWSLNFVLESRMLVLGSASLDYGLLLSLALVSWSCILGSESLEIGTWYLDHKVPVSQSMELDPYILVFEPS